MNWNGGTSRKSQNRSNRYLSFPALANSARERGTRLVEVAHKDRNGKGWATRPASPLTSPFYTIPYTFSPNRSLPL